MRRSIPATRAGLCSTGAGRWSGSSPPSPIHRATARSSASALRFRSAPRAAVASPRPNDTRRTVNRQSTLDASLEQVLYEVKRVIVGQDALLERMVVALLARGHLLVEGVPGLAKTLAVNSLAQAPGVDFQRIQ